MQLFKKKYSINYHPHDVKTHFRYCMHAGYISKIVSMVRKYHNNKLQTNPWLREEEPHNNHETPGRQTKQSNQLSLFSIKIIAKLEWTYSNVHQNIEQLQTPTMGVTIKNKSTTTEPPRIYVPSRYRYKNFSIYPKIL